MKTTSIFWILTKNNKNWICMILSIKNIDSAGYWINDIESAGYRISKILNIRDILNLCKTEHEGYWICGICGIRNIKDIELLEYGTLRILNLWNLWNTEHQGYWIYGIRDIKDIWSGGYWIKFSVWLADGVLLYM